MYTEDQIIEGCIAGKRKFQLALYEKFSGKMFAICYRYAKSAEEAEDVLQDGFLKVFTKIGQFSREHSFEGWMKRVFVNTAITNYKQNLKHYYKEDITEIQEIELEYSSFGDADYTKEELKNVVDGISDGYKVVFNLYAIEGFKHREIADMLGIDVATSKSQYHRARKLIQKKLKELSKIKPYG